MDFNNLTITPAEQKTLDWCRHALTEKQVAPAKDKPKKSRKTKPNKFWCR